MEKHPPPRPRGKPIGGPNCSTLDLLNELTTEWQKLLPDSPSVPYVMESRSDAKGGDVARVASTLRVPLELQKHGEHPGSKVQTTFGINEAIESVTQGIAAGRSSESNRQLRDNQGYDVDSADVRLVRVEDGLIVRGWATARDIEVWKTWKGLAIAVVAPPSHTLAKAMTEGENVTTAANRIAEAYMARGTRNDFLTPEEDAALRYLDARHERERDDVVDPMLRETLEKSASRDLLILEARRCGDFLIRKHFESHGTSLSMCFNPPALGNCLSLILEKYVSFFGVHDNKLLGAGHLELRKEIVAEVLKSKVAPQEAELAKARALLEECVPKKAVSLKREIKRLENEIESAEAELIQMEKDGTVMGPDELQAAANVIGIRMQIKTIVCNPDSIDYDGLVPDKIFEPSTGAASLLGGVACIVQRNAFLETPHFMFNLEQSSGPTSPAPAPTPAETSPDVEAVTNLGDDLASPRTALPEAQTVAQTPVQSPPLSPLLVKSTVSTNRKPPQRKRHTLNSARCGSRPSPTAPSPSLSGAEEPSPVNAQKRPPRPTTRNAQKATTSSTQSPKSMRREVPPTPDSIKRVGLTGREFEGKEPQFSDSEGSSGNSFEDLAGLAPKIVSDMPTPPVEGLFDLAGHFPAPPGAKTHPEVALEAAPSSGEAQSLVITYPVLSAIEETADATAAELSSFEAILGFAENTGSQRMSFKDMMFKFSRYATGFRKFRDIQFSWNQCAGEKRVPLRIRIKIFKAWLENTNERLSRVSDNDQSSDDELSDDDMFGEAPLNSTWFLLCVHQVSDESDEGGGIVSLNRPSCVVALNFNSFGDLPNIIKSHGVWAETDSAGRNMGVRYLKIIVDALTAASTAKPPFKSTSPMSINNSTDQILKSASMASSGRMSVGVQLCERTAVCMAEATQVAVAAGVCLHLQRLQSKPEEFNRWAVYELLNVMANMLRDRTIEAQRIDDLRAQAYDASTPALRKAQESIAYYCTTLANEFRDGGVQVQASDIGRALKSGDARDSLVNHGEEEVDHAVLVSILEALSGGSDEQVGVAALKLCEMLLLRNRNSDENGLPLLISGLGRRKYFSRQRIIEALEKALGRAPSTPTIDRALDADHALQHTVLKQSVANGSKTVNIFDNGSERTTTTSGQRVGKHPKQIDVTVCVTLLEKLGFKLKDDTGIPTWTDGDGRVVTGRDIETAINASEFTLEAIDANDPAGRTFRQQLDSYVFQMHMAEVHRVMHNLRRSNRAEWKGFVVPENNQKVDLTAETSKKYEDVDVFGMVQQFSHEVMLENSLTKVGTLRILRQIVKTLDIDVASAAHDVIFNQSDQAVHIIAGDHATMEGLEQNRADLFAAIAEFARTDTPPSDDPHLLDQIFLLLCTIIFEYQRGDLHGGFAMSDSQVKTFDRLIFQFIRMHYPELRHLSGKKHLVKEDDHWCSLFKTTKLAGYDEAIEAWVKQASVDAGQSVPEFTKGKSLEELTQSFEVFVEFQVFGALSSTGAAAAPPEAAVDQPAAHLYSFLFTATLKDLFSMAERANHEEVKQLVYRFFHPLMVKQGKKNYAWLIAKVIVFMHCVSKEAKRHFDVHSGYVERPRSKKCSSLDRICEHHVDAATADKGQAMQTEAGLQKSSRHASLVDKYKRHTANFTGHTSGDNDRSVESARMPSRKKIRLDLFNAAQMALRPTFGPRRTYDNILKRFANSRTCCVTLDFLKGMIVEIFRNEVIFIGFSGSELVGAESLSSRDSVICVRCGQLLSNASRTDDAGADDVDAGTDQDRRAEQCMFCDIAIDMETIESCGCCLGGCDTLACSDCMLRDGGLLKKTPAALKTLLRGREYKTKTGLDIPKAKHALLSAIEYLQKMVALENLLKANPSLSADSIGTPPAPGAVLGSIGSTNLSSSPARPGKISLGDVIDLAGSLPGVQEPVLGNDGRYEVKVEMNGNVALGITLGVERAIIIESDVCIPTSTAIITGGDEIDDDDYDDVDDDDVRTASSGFVVKSVPHTSEGRRLSIVPGDILEKVNGHQVGTFVSLEAEMKRRPLWLQFARIGSPNTQLPYERPKTALVVLSYYQPHCPGDGAHVSTGELFHYGYNKGGPQYAQKRREEEATKSRNPEDAAILKTHMVADTMAASAASRGSTRNQTDTGLAKRGACIEPTLMPFKDTTLPLILPFLRAGGSGDISIHSDLIMKYIRTKFRPKMVKQRMDRALVLPYVKKYFESHIRGHVESRCSGQGIESNSSGRLAEAGICLAISELRQKEATAMQGEAISLQMQKETREVRYQCCSYSPSPQYRICTKIRLFHESGFLRKTNLPCMGMKSRSHRRG